MAQLAVTALQPLARACKRHYTFARQFHPFKRQESAQWKNATQGIDLLKDFRYLSEAYGPLLPSSIG
jgi:hypothetical protein